MKCPHCGYAHGWIWVTDEKFQQVDGDKGDFYYHPVYMDRKDCIHDKCLYGCPSCGKTFIEL